MCSHGPRRSVLKPEGVELRVRPRCDRLEESLEPGRAGLAGPPGGPDPRSCRGQDELANSLFTQASVWV